MLGPEVFGSSEVVSQILPSMFAFSALAIVPHCSPRLHDSGGLAAEIARASRNVDE